LFYRWIFSFYSEGERRSDARKEPAMTMLTLTILITILKNPVALKEQGLRRIIAEAAVTAASAWTAYACTGSRAQQLLEEPYSYRG
jgi:hypothetical protein